MGMRVRYSARVLYSHREEFARCMGFEYVGECFGEGDSWTEFIDVESQNWSGIELAAAKGLIFEGEHGAYGGAYDGQVFLAVDGDLQAFPTLEDGYPVVEVRPHRDEPGMINETDLDEQIQEATIFTTVKTDLRERIAKSEPVEGGSCPVCGGTITHTEGRERFRDYSISGGPEKWRTFKILVCEQSCGWEEGSSEFVEPDPPILPPRQVIGRKGGETYWNQTVRDWGSLADATRFYVRDLWEIRGCPLREINVEWLKVDA